MSASAFNWIGTGAYPGLQPFRFGNVIAADAQEARAKLADLWRTISPIEPPDIEPARGMLLFNSDA